MTRALLSAIILFSVPTAHAQRIVPPLEHLSRKLSECVFDYATMRAVVDATPSEIAAAAISACRLEMSEVRQSLLRRYRAEVDDDPDFTLIDKIMSDTEEDMHRLALAAVIDMRSEIVSPLVGK